MLFRNELTEYQGTRHRLIDIDQASRLAWLIALDDPYAMPFGVPLEVIAGLKSHTPATSGATFRTSTDAEVLRRNQSYELLKPLLAHGRSLFDEQQRSAHIKLYCSTGVCSVPTAYKLLRKWWKNGQTIDALLPRFRKAGRSDPGVTAGRGAPKANGIATYQMTQEDYCKMDAVIRSLYLKDNRILITHTYQRLLEKHYTFIDGNGEAFLLSIDKRPSLRQFKYYLSKHYSHEQRLRMRKGDKEFDLNHRGVLGSVEDDCNGIGHIYECDATIGDVMLCANDDKLSYIGKPTIYIIIDRRSRLIVGLYVGLENASWVCAREAILFICEDKEAVCARYGVEYNEADWPAHGIFPEIILADLGEWNSRGGEQLATNLATRVAFVPARRADWKPCVETNFNQIRATLQDGIPGMDPPNNANKRQKQDYLSKASLTLHEFTKVMLEHVIKHNRSIVKSYQLSSADLRDKFRPTPIEIWNKEVVERAGLLTRYSLDHVQFQLLPRGTASVTEHGVLFENCYYTSERLMRRGWFSDARNGRFKVDIAHDHRLVDHIYVLDVDGTAEPCLCSLTPRSQMHAGRSLAEVRRYTERLKLLEAEVEQHDRQVTSEFHSRIDPVIATSKKRLSAAPKRSRSARRADTKQARAIELQQERGVTGQLDRGKAKPNLPAATVLDFKLEREKRTEAEVTTPPAPTSLVHNEPRGTGLEELTRQALARLRAKQGGM